MQSSDYSARFFFQFIAELIFLFFVLVAKQSFQFSTIDDENGEKLDEMFQLKPSFLRVQPSRCILPPKFIFYAQKVRDFTVYEDDVWMISYPRTGKCFKIRSILNKHSCIVH